MNRCGHDKQLIRTFSPCKIYQYSDAMLKDLRKDSLKKLEKTVLYSKQPVYFDKTTIDRRINNGSGAGTSGAAAQIAARKENYAKDLNIDERIETFQNHLKNEYVYRIPLRYFTNLGKINLSIKIDFRIKCHMETDMKKMFQSKTVYVPGATIPSSPDAKTIFTNTPFIQHKHILLDKNFRQYLETIMVSKKLLQMGAQKTPMEKTYEIDVGSNSINVDFLGSNRQFDWLEISLVFDKSNKYVTLYDSYNVELASKYVKLVKLSNFTEIFSLTNEKKYSMDSLTQKYLLYKQFVAWCCNGCSTAPLTDYIKNQRQRPILFRQK